MSVWNSVYFISSNKNNDEGEYSWTIDIMKNERVIKTFTIMADHINDAVNKVTKLLKPGQIARIDGFKYVEA